MKRREFIGGAGGAVLSSLSWPIAARAQEKVRRIGVLVAVADSDAEVKANVAAFEQALQKLGWIEGRNARIYYRWGGGDSGRIRAQAKELVSLDPDVILVSTGLALQPLLQETSRIPIVFTQIVDPVGAGLVASLARPGGNLTGFTVAEFSIFGKLLELLKEVVPHMTRAAVILHPDQKPQAGMLRAIEAVAPSLRVELVASGVRDAAALERAIDQFAREPNGGVVVLPNPVTDGNRGLIIAMAERHRLPTAYFLRPSVVAGGLVSYGPDLADQFRQAATYVDRILRGEKPAELPVQQPTNYKLAINLKTAKALGIEVSPTLMARADEVIE